MTATPNTTASTDRRVEATVAELTLDEKASLTAGRDIWHLPPVDRLGIGSLKMSDGPSGVRGEKLGIRRSLAFPCGLAAGSTWDVELIGRYGTALAAEARSKGVHLLLGPTVCIPRTPLGGRTFESFTEDPYLSARLTVAYVRGVQGEGVGCCVKHFACNDQEHERMTISAEVDPVTLREVHLRSFEAAVGEAGVWTVMSAYNRVNGTYCGEHPQLLGEILKDEWGFDGVVVSDWLGTHSTVEAAVAGLDIEMPGPGAFLGPKLATAVASGEVDEAVLDDHARRIVRLLDRCGVLDGVDAREEDEADDPDRRRLARQLVTDSAVLLRNEGVLPLDPTGVRRVAIVGPNATRLESGGGGSSAVTPLRDLSPIDELRARLPGVEVVYEQGCRLSRDLPRIDHRMLAGGLRVEFFDESGFDGEPVGSEVVWRGEYSSLGDPLPGLAGGSYSARATARFTPDTTGTWTLGVTSAGKTRLLLDGELVVDNTEPAPGDSFYGLGSEVAAAELALEAGRSYELSVEFEASGLPLSGFKVCASEPLTPDALARAVDAARHADVAVVVVGSSPDWETEGADRADLRLAGDQDELIRQVAAANADTVVVVNAGGPIEMPWVDDVAAVLELWYPGEEGAPALAEILTGEAEPGGRLPITFPAKLADSASHGWYPGSEGTVTYGEGLLVGYRHADANDVEPLFCFGHGLSYTTFELGAATVTGTAPALTVEVPVTNTGDRRGSQVVQVYAGRVDRPAGRPLRQLAGFAKVEAEPGATVAATIAVDRRAFERWDEDAGAFVLVPGAYELAVGTSSRALAHRHQVDVANRA